MDKLTHCLLLLQHAGQMDKGPLRRLLLWHLKRRVLCECGALCAFQWWGRKREDRWWDWGVRGDGGLRCVGVVLPCARRELVSGLVPVKMVSIAKGYIRLNRDKRFNTAAK